MFRRCFLRRCARSGPFDPYRILGLPAGSAPAEIKKRYHALALRYHPDSGRPESSKARFQAVQEAYEAVKDGKWQQQPSSSGAAQHQDAYGFDPKSKQYVYEQPGSTNDNYVSANGRLQTSLRVVMVWCFCFFIARFALLKVFPPSREEAERRRAQRTAAANALDAASVHAVELDGPVHFSQPQSYSASLQGSSGWGSAGR